MQIKNLNVAIEGSEEITSFQVSTAAGWRWVGLKGNPTAAAIIAAAMDEIAEEDEGECPCMGTKEGCEICCPYPGEDDGPIESIDGGDYTPSPKNEDDDEIPF